MPVWGLSQTFKAFVKGTVVASSITVSPAKARTNNTCFPAKTSLTKVGQL